MAASLSLMISPPFSISSKPPLSLPSQHTQLLFRNQWPPQIPFKKPEPLATSTAANNSPLIAAAGGGSGGGGGGGGSAQEEKWVHEGEITESLPNGMFWVRIDTNGELVLGHLSGRIRKSFIRVLPGDRVKIEVSRYDSSRGRITYRLRGGKDATT